MALQFALATINPSNEVYMHSYPSTNLPGAQTAYTYMCWLNSTSFAAAPIQSMCGMYNGTNDSATTPTTGLQIGSGQSATAGAIDAWTFGGTVLVSTTGYTAPVNTWIHVAYTCTALAGTQTHSLYINGVLNNTATNALQTAGTMTMVYLNGFPQTTTAANTYTETSNTQLDDIWVFNRQLSASEILTIYNTRGMRDGIVNGQVARYNFNEAGIGAATTGSKDFSGQGNNLVVVNRGGGVVPTYIADTNNIDTRSPQG